MKLLVSCLVIAAMPGVAFGQVPTELAAPPPAEAPAAPPGYYSYPPPASEANALRASQSHVELSPTSRGGVLSLAFRF